MNSPTNQLQQRPLLLRIAGLVLFINHVVGWIGLNSRYSDTFEQLTWLNLLVSGGVVFATGIGFSYRLLAGVVMSYSIGMAVEIAGVHTGRLFGDYYYPATLGAAFYGVPLIIGLNWVLLSYCTYVVVSKWSLPGLLPAFTAALLMLGIDVLLEPFAIKHGFWVWTQAHPPLQNYVAWLLVSLLIQFIFIRLQLTTVLPLAGFYLLVLISFLMADGWIGKMWQNFLGS